MEKVKGIKGRCKSILVSALVATLSIPLSVGLAAGVNDDASDLSQTARDVSSDSAYLQVENVDEDGNLLDIDAPESGEAFWFYDKTNNRSYWLPCVSPGTYEMEVPDGTYLVYQNKVKPGYIRDETSPKEVKVESYFHQSQNVDRNIYPQSLRLEKVYTSRYEPYARYSHELTITDYKKVNQVRGVDEHTVVRPFNGEALGLSARVYVDNHQNIGPGDTFNIRFDNSVNTGAQLSQAHDNHFKAYTTDGTLIALGRQMSDSYGEYIQYTFTNKAQYGVPEYIDAKAIMYVDADATNDFKDWAGKDSKSGYIAPTVTINNQKKQSSQIFVSYDDYANMDEATKFNMASRFLTYDRKTGEYSALIYLNPEGKVSSELSYRPAVTFELPHGLNAGNGYGEDIKLRGFFLNGHYLIKTNTIQQGNPVPNDFVEGSGWFTDANEYKELDGVPAQLPRKNTMPYSMGLDISNLFSTNGNPFTWKPAPVRTEGTWWPNQYNADWYGTSDYQTILRLHLGAKGGLCAGNRITADDGKRSPFAYVVYVYGKSQPNSSNPLAFYSDLGDTGGATPEDIINDNNVGWALNNWMIEGPSLSKLPGADSDTTQIEPSVTKVTFVNKKIFENEIIFKNLDATYKNPDTYTPIQNGVFYLRNLSDLSDTDVIDSDGDRSGGDVVVENSEGEFFYNKLLPGVYGVYVRSLPAFYQMPEDSLVKVIRVDTNGYAYVDPIKNDEGQWEGGILVSGRDEEGALVSEPVEILSRAKEIEFTKIYKDEQGYEDLEFAKGSYPQSTFKLVHWANDSDFEDAGQDRWNRYEVVEGIVQGPDGQETFSTTVLNSADDGRFSFPYKGRGYYGLIETDTPYSYQMLTKNPVKLFYVMENNDQLMFSIGDGTVSDDEITSSFEYWVTYDQLGSFLNVTNKKNPTFDFTLKKLDEQGNPLAHTTFNLQVGNPAEGGYDKNAETDDNGLLHFENVPFGNLQIVEVKPSDGYIRSDEVRVVPIGPDAEYTVPQNPSNSKDLSDMFKISVFEADDMDIEPIQAGVLDTRIKLDLENAAKFDKIAKAGDYFKLYFSDNVDIGGIYPNAGAAPQIRASGGLLAEGRWFEEDGRRGIKFSLSNYIDQFSLGQYAKLELPLYINPQVVKKDSIQQVSASLLKSDASVHDEKKLNLKGSESDVDIDVLYEGGVAQDVHEVNFGTHLTQVDPSKKRLTDIIYLNPYGVSKREDVALSTLTIKGDSESMKKLLNSKADIGVYKVEAPDSQTMPPSYGFTPDMAGITDVTDAFRPRITFGEQAITIDLDGIDMGPSGYVLVAKYRIPSSVDPWNLHGDISHRLTYSHTKGGHEYTWWLEYHNFIETHEAKGSIQQSRMVTVYNKPNQVEFTKVNNTMEAMEGVHFTLYKKTDEGNIKVPGYEDIVSGEMGKFKLEKIAPGFYELHETKSLSGYELPANPVVTFRVDEDTGQFELLANTTNLDPSMMELIINKQPLPTSGDRRRVILMSIGVFALGVSCAVYYSAEKKHTTL